ncbi:MAG TPA: homocysteine S-methyltransferase family protein, partial [Polyangia bacterium]|nr:homocysteine S-methyltransferase family protein [Polyangia bacterium]
MLSRAFSIRRPRWSLDERCRRFPLLQALRERVLVFDGAMGTMIHTAQLTLDDYGGKENCVELLNERRPDVIASIHEAYLKAGADIVETNSFGSMPIVLGEFGLADEAYHLSRRAAEVACEVAAGFSTKERPRWVAGSVGPTTKMVSLGHIAFAEQFASYVTQIHGLIDGGVDVVQIETQYDLLNLKAAVLAAREAMRRAEREVPIIAQVTIET